MAPTRPISVRLTHDLLARIDAAVADGRAKHRNAFITQACERALRLLAADTGQPLARQEIEPAHAPQGSATRCWCGQPHDREPETVQERAVRGEPDAVRRMAVAASFDPDGDIAGADYPPQP